MSDPLVLVRDEGPVRWLTLNRPDKRNALSAELVTALREALAAPGDARCLALAGAGKAFSAGADLAALEAMRDASYEDNLADSLLLAGLFQEIAEHPLPIVAVVHGAALGGGAGLALACDEAFFGPGATVGFTEVRIGFVPAIVLNFLLRVVGEREARFLALTGERLSGDEAEALGLGTLCDDPDEAVAQMGALYASTSPEAVARTKRLFLELRPLSLADGLRAGAEANARARATDDCREGIAAFLEKRNPRWIEDQT